jgi:hypothetical protein
VALQGDLSSFALPDVLRLLAGTGKSGRLEVSGPSGWGEVVLSDGTITSGAVERAPHAAEPGDVVFELLRFEGGAFTFDEVEGAAGVDGADVEQAIADAEALVAEWADVETVVPSMEAWVALCPELPGDSIHLVADQWRALVAVAGGGSVRDLAGALDLTDLAACRQVKELVEADLVAVRPNHAYSEPLREPFHVPTVELDSFEEYETDLADPMTELEDLVVEDRPVVMTEREDALLPEPLPGEGVAFEGELLAGAVDRRTFDTAESPSTEEPAAGHLAVAEEAPEHLTIAEDPSVDAPTDADESHHDHDGEADQAGSGDHLEDAVDHEHPGIDGALNPAAEADAFEAALAAADGEVEAPAEVDDERGSLLRFLSSVKP